MDRCPLLRLLSRLRYLDSYSGSGFRRRVGAALGLRV